MKKGIAVLVVMVGMALGLVAWADPADETIAQTDQNQPASELTEVIDGIAVPYRVLLDAQMEHPGYAVMQARKVNRDGQDRYALHMQGSDGSSGRFNLYLLYDMEWRLMGEETFLAPPEEPQPPATEPASGQPETDDNNSRGNDRHDQEDEDEGVEEPAEEPKPDRKPRRDPDMLPPPGYDE